jgi:hypothetical protein
VGITRHDNVGFSLSSGNSDRNKFLDVSKKLACLFTEPDSHISSNLIVSASACVKLASDRPDELA